MWNQLENSGTPLIWNFNVFFFLFFPSPNWCQANAQDLGTGCITLSVHPSLQSSFAQTCSNAAIWTCLVDPPGSVRGVSQFPGVRHKQTGERWSCQGYWFPTTAALTGSTQRLLQTRTMWVLTEEPQNCICSGVSRTGGARVNRCCLAWCRDCISANIILLLPHRGLVQRTPLSSVRNYLFLVQTKVIMLHAQLL